ncbi:MAG: folate-binding protein YgfZ [Leptothrix ochracea]|uniref:CAF17-like 4Fe-4S cluster assembly/insertion protein YgfZ n=1 Tax=Leptothrix ochracea TaxID=735331 RepID=UPI0034E2D44C
MSIPFSAALCSLPDWAVLRVQGSDAATFLHSQLSTDFKRLSATQGRLGAYCNPQGRMLASFIGVLAAPEEIWLACPADVLPSVQKRLSMFVLRAKVTLQAASDVSVMGWVSPTGAAAPQDLATIWASQGPTAGQNDGVAVRLPDALGQTRGLWLTRTPHTPEAQTLDPALWAWLEVHSGVAPVTAATSGLFVPQMLNYDQVGGVDFKKGCYPGQEIVARTHYLGKVKRHAYVIEAESPLHVGQPLFSSEDAAQPAGQIVRLAADPEHSGRIAAIAEIKSAATEGGSLHLDHGAGLKVRLVEPQPRPHQPQA